MIAQPDLARIAASFSSNRHDWVALGCHGHCRDELEARFSGRTSAWWDARFELGGIYVNGKAAGPDQVIQAGDVFEFYFHRYEPHDARTHFPQVEDDMVLFRDSDFAVVFKPAGLPSTAPRDQIHHNLQAYLEAMFGQPVHLPSRLDVAVSGLVLASLSARMNRHLQRAYERRLVEKYYVAEVSGVADWSEREVNHPIGRSSLHPVLRSVDPRCGQAAATSFKALVRVSAQDRTLLRAEPLTGRTHQIRIHCAAEGHPVVGDPYYGGEVCEQLHLLSFALGIYHPWQKRRLFFEVPAGYRPQWLTAYSTEFSSDLIGRRFSQDGSDEGRHSR